MTCIDTVHCSLANGTCGVSFAATSLTQLAHDYHWQEELNSVLVLCDVPKIITRLNFTPLVINL